MKFKITKAKYVGLLVLVGLLAYSPIIVSKMNFTMGWGCVNANVDGPESADNSGSDTGSGGSENSDNDDNNTTENFGSEEESNAEQNAAFDNSGSDTGSGGSENSDNDDNNTTENFGSEEESNAEQNAALGEDEYGGSLTDSRDRGKASSDTISDWEHEKRDKETEAMFADDPNAYDVYSSPLDKVESWGIAVGHSLSHAWNGLKDWGRSTWGRSTEAISNFYASFFPGNSGSDTNFAINSSSGYAEQYSKGNTGQQNNWSHEDDKSLRQCLSGMMVSPSGCAQIISKYNNRVSQVSNDAIGRLNKYKHELDVEITRLSNELGGLRAQLQSEENRVRRQEIQERINQTKSQLQRAGQQRDSVLGNINQVRNANIDSHGCIIGVTIWQPDHNACLTEVEVGNYCRSRGGTYHGRGGCTCSNGLVWTRSGCR